jgi:hypothetical protein
MNHMEGDTTHTPQADVDSGIRWVNAATTGRLAALAPVRFGRAAANPAGGGSAGWNSLEDFLETEPTAANE